MGFRKDFKWGTATAAYQIEGGAFEDGKGLSIWDVMSHSDGFVFDNQNGDTACDSYHRYKEDVEIMKKIGTNAYRFSVAWARVFPDGIGQINEKGLDYYDRLTDELLSAGISPYVTLYHWDLPYELHKKGGWLNRDIAGYFGEYAAAVSKRLGDRVKNFFTINEPQCVIGGGYANASNAPGLARPTREVLLGIHTSLLAHAEGFRAIKDNVSDVRVGFAPIGNIYHPLRETEECIEAARRETFKIHSPEWSNTAWAEPIINGKYPDDMMEKFGSLMEIKNGDMEKIHTGLDMYAFNTYQSCGVDVDDLGNVIIPKKPDGHARTTFDWDVNDKCLYWGAKFFSERYHLPVIISENGTAVSDWICRDGKIHDAQRSDYLMRHIENLRHAAEEGVDVEGYFLWSLLDNFEWRQGYNQRFGIVYVDFLTKERTLKDSAFVYSDIIKNNGEI